MTRAMAGQPPRLHPINLETDRGLVLHIAALRKIRLYREAHGTFEDYCEERWGWGDRRARRLMAASEAVESVVEPITGAVGETDTSGTS